MCLHLQMLRQVVFAKQLKSTHRKLPASTKQQTTDKSLHRIKPVSKSQTVETETELKGQWSFQKLLFKTVQMSNGLHYNYLPVCLCRAHSLWLYPMVLVTFYSQKHVLTCPCLLNLFIFNWRANYFLAPKTGRNCADTKNPISKFIRRASLIVKERNTHTHYSQWQLPAVPQVRLLRWCQWGRWRLQASCSPGWVTGWRNSYPRRQLHLWWGGWSVRSRCWWASGGLPAQMPEWRCDPSLFGHQWLSQCHGPYLRRTDYC